MALYDERDRVQKMNSWMGWSALIILLAALFLAVLFVANHQGSVRPQRVDGAAPTPPTPPVTRTVPDVPTPPQPPRP